MYSKVLKMTKRFDPNKILLNKSKISSAIFRKVLSIYLAKNLEANQFREFRPTHHRVVVSLNCKALKGITQKTLINNENK